MSRRWLRWHSPEGLSRTRESLRDPRQNLKGSEGCSLFAKAKAEAAEAADTDGESSEAAADVGETETVESAAAVAG